MSDLYSEVVNENGFIYKRKSNVIETLENNQNK